MKNLDLKISPLANQQLDEFYAYCSISYGCKKADNIYVLIKRTFNDFCIFPGMGQIEPLLSDFPQCFRSFTQHPNTKIIYWVEDNTVKIALLFIPGKHRRNSVIRLRTGRIGFVSHRLLLMVNRNK